MTATKKSRYSIYKSNGAYYLNAPGWIIHAYGPDGRGTDKLIPWIREIILGRPYTPRIMHRALPSMLSSDDL